MEDGHCDIHGRCVEKVERLERDVCAQKNDIKDARKSLTHDLERRDTHFDATFVTKHEFEPIRKLVYGVAGLMLAEVIRRILV